MGGMMGGEFGAYGTVGLILNLVITLGVIIGLVLLVVWAVRRLSAEGSGIFSSSRSEVSKSSPKEIAQMRYARGEITREQYQEILSDLA